MARTSHTDSCLSPSSAITVFLVPVKQLVSLIKRKKIINLCHTFEDWDLYHLVDVGSSKPLEIHNEYKGLRLWIFILLLNPRKCFWDFCFLHFVKMVSLFFNELLMLIVSLEPYFPYLSFLLSRNALRGKGFCI